MKSKQGLVTVIVCVLLGVMVLFTFYGLAESGKSLEAGDAPLSAAAMIKRALSRGYFSSASPAVGLGSIGPILTGDYTAILYRVLPVAKVEEGVMALGVFLASLFFYLFLRERGFGVCAAMAGGVTLGFSTLLISIAKAGHTGKFTGVAYLAAALWCMERRINGKSFVWSLFAGLAVGLSLAQSRDLALLLCLALAAYWLFVLVRRSQVVRSLPVSLLGAYMAAAVIALITTWPVMKMLVPAASGGTATVAPIAESPKERWDWATQWSVPADELIKLINPSYCGWDSWHQDAPYWGRMGRSAGWEKSHEGFRNFTQTNEYLGIIVFLLALGGFAGVLAGARRKDPGDFAGGNARADVLFWGILGLVALILALGRYGFLYKFFYLLPIMDSIRNPVKFMHVVGFAIAVLAAHGVSLLEQSHEQDRINRRKVLITFTVVGGLSALFFLFQLLSAPWESKEFTAQLISDGFGQQVTGIKNAMLSGTIRCFLFSGLFILLVVLFWLRKLMALTAGRWFACGIVVLLIGADFLGVNRRYISYYDPFTMYRSNVLIDYLRRFPEYRTKFVPHNWAVFNQWNSLLVPYFCFKSADVPAESRRASDVKLFNTMLETNPAAAWKLMGVKHVVMVRQLEKEIMGMLGTSGRIIKSVDFVKEGDSIGVRMSETNGQSFCAVAEIRDAIPCGQWVPRAEVTSMSGVIQRMLDPAFDPRKLVLVDEAFAEQVKEAGVPADGVVAEGTSRLLEYTENIIRIECDTSAPGWVLINDIFDPNWKASVGGKPVPLVRANCVFRAVPVPAGRHTVEVEYRTGAPEFWVPLWVTIALVVAAAGTGAWQYRRRSALPSDANKVK